MSHAAAGPSPRPRIEKKRQVRTSAILDEAMRILASEGLDALTLGRLAHALDYVPAALYRYFASKDALLAALQRRAVEEIHAGLTDALVNVAGRTARASDDVALLARLLAAARYYLDLPATHPQAFFLVAALVGDPRVLLSDEESRRTAPMLLGLLGGVEATFRDAADKGALGRGDSMERTLAFWAVLQGALSLEKARRMAPALPSAARVGSAAVTAMLVGWGASPPHLARAERLLTSDATTKKARS